MNRAPNRRLGARARAAGAVALVVVLPAILAAMGCAGSGPRVGQGARVAVLLPPSERPFWDPIARAFESAHPGVQVDLVEGPQSTDLRENLYTASLLARDPTFDLIYMDVTWTPKFAGAGWLLALDDAFREEIEAYLPGAVAAGRFQGRLYRVPVRTDMGLLYYRRDWLEAAGLGPPETFDDLTRVARALQDPPARWGFVWQGKQYEGLVCGFLEVLEGHGGFWVDPENENVGLDRPEAIAAATFLARCASPGGISPPGVATYQEEESRRLFHDGRAALLRNWPYVWRLSQGEESPIRDRVGVMAMVHAPGGRSVGTLGGWGLGVSAFSRQRATAIEFIRFATTLESQRLLCGPTGYAPARIAAYRDSALIASNPFLTRLFTLHEHAVPRPAIPRYARASDILQRHLSAALSGAVAPERAMRAAAAETRLLLGVAVDHAGGAR